MEPYVDNFGISPFARGDERRRNKLMRLFARFALTFGCSQRGKSGITCVRRFAMDKPVNGSQKAVFVAVITVYGTVQELTQKVGIRARGDGGRFPRNKTHV